MLTGVSTGVATTAFNALTEPALVYLHDHVSETNSLCFIYYFALISTCSFGLLIAPSLPPAKARARKTNKARTRWEGGSSVRDRAFVLFFGTAAAAAAAAAMDRLGWL